MRYVIVGAGPAGVVAAETLRAQDPAGEVIMIGGEPEPAYSRMAIPYLLAGHIEEAGTYLRHNPEHFNNIGVRQMHDRVIALDTANKSVLLQGGDSVAYDRLLLATGSKAVAPPMAGLDQPGIYHCWTLEDARNIARHAERGARVVLMGAGFIGCIIMEALYKRGVDLTVVEMNDRMVPRMMDQVSGNLIKRWCLDKGVTVHTNTRLVGVAPDPTGQARYTLECDKMGSITADLVVVATGVRPDIDYLQGSLIETKLGIVVDEYLQTSVPGVYAAGDACEGFDWSSGKHAVHAIQPVAADTGRMAALNMAGGEARYAGSMDMNVLDTLGLISTSYGRWQGVQGGEEATLLDEEGYRYLKLQFEGEYLIGSISLGLTEHVGVLRGLIQGRVRLGVWKQRLMENPSRIMEAYLARTQFPGAA